MTQPKYQLIAQTLRTRIEEGTYPEGQLSPRKLTSLPVSALVAPPCAKPSSCSSTKVCWSAGNAGVRWYGKAKLHNNLPTSSKVTIKKSPLTAVVAGPTCSHFVRNLPRKRFSKLSTWMPAPRFTNWCGYALPMMNPSS